MNLFTLSYSYLRRRALNTFLNILLLSFGIATIVVLLLFSYQLEDNLYKNAEGVDVVVGAKGSPIQLILSSIFHIDNPTGNVELHEAKELMNNPMVASDIPLALGDNYRGYRIVGTTSRYLEHYGAELAEGDFWDHEFELVVGATVAENEGLNPGDTIFSSHGFSAAGHTHDDHSLMVVGILGSTGTVLDRLILTGVETMWGIHEEHDHDDEDHHDHSHSHSHDDEDSHSHDHEEGHGHDHDHEHEHEHEEHHHHEDPGHTHNEGDDHTSHNHDHNHEHGESSDHDQSHDHSGSQSHSHSHVREVTDDSYLQEDYADEQITSMLIRYQNPLAAARFPRFVNENTSMQAAAPAVEITRLLNLLGVGLDAIQIFAYILILASVLGIFIALLNSMKERKYDLAIMRSLGGSRSKLFVHVLLEGVIISMTGAVLGMILGHLAVEAIGNLFAEAQQFAVTGRVFIPGEGWILMVAVGIGVFSAIVPAVMAYQTDIAETLSKTT